MEPLKTREGKNRQINKETKIAIFLYLMYFLWWYVTGYGFFSRNQKNYTYILGLPMWFFLSCIVGYIWFCIATIIVTKYFFKDFSLEEDDDE